MDGILIVNKEAGFTSHDVVAKLRKMLHQKKIGHTGTLDPDATGVLPVCIGKATKVCDVLTDRDKTYEARVRLGITTDTLDTSGTVLERKDVTVTGDGLARVLSRFTGEITQIPPMYSAVKVNGKRLYEYAREGIEVERKERRVRIHEITLLGDTEVDLSEGWFSIRIRCSKGTYIRTLCDDIGRELGCGAAMDRLIRTSVGRFGIEQSMTLSEIEEKLSEIEKWVLPIDRVFDAYPKVELPAEGHKRLINGNPLPVSLIDLHPSEGELIRVYDDGIFYALYRFNKKKKYYQVEKFFR